MLFSIPRGNSLSSGEGSVGVTQGLPNMALAGLCRVFTGLQVENYVFKF